jgi:hypothetical protein
MRTVAVIAKFEAKPGTDAWAEADTLTNIEPSDANEFGVDADRCWRTPLAQSPCCCLSVDSHNVVRRNASKMFKKAALYFAK